MKTKEVLAERLDGLMAAVPHLGTQLKLAKTTGIGQTTIGRIRRGEVNPTLENVKRIAEAFRVPVSYLYGETDVMGRPEDEASLLALAEEAASQDLAELYDRISQWGRPGMSVLGKVPVISWEQAGAWPSLFENFRISDAEQWAHCPFQHGTETFALRIVGDSMYNPAGTKSFAAGDVVAVDPSIPPKSQSIVVVRPTQDDKAAVLRQILIEPDGYRVLRTLNPDWPRSLIEMSADAAIIGTVIGKWVAE